MITATAFLALACPIVLTCIPSELERAKWLSRKRIIDCQLSLDGSEAIVVVVALKARSLHSGSLDGLLDASFCEHKVVACNLRSQATRPRVLLETACWGCWGWFDRTGTLLISDDRGHLLSLAVGSPQQAPRPLIQPATLRDIQVSSDFCLINDSSQLSYYERVGNAQLGQPIWSSPANVESFALLPQSNRLVVARRIGEQHHVYLAEVATGQDIGLLASVPHQVDRIQVLPKSKQLLIVCGQRAGLLSWQVISDPLDTPLVNWISTGISSLAVIAPDEQSIVTTCPDGSQLVVWDSHARKRVRTFDTSNSIIIDAEFLDTDRFVTWGKDSKLRIWNLNSNQVEREIDL